MRWNPFASTGGWDRRRARHSCRPTVQELESRCLLSLTELVNPFIGTGGSGWFAGDVFPGADTPFGMLQFSPDTPSNIPGGYAYSDNTIKGFSLDHFSGRGCQYMDDIPLMPLIGPVTQSPLSNPGAFRSTFSHSNESASPGYYRVLVDSGIQVELTTTTRTGFASLTFPDSSRPNSVIVNVGGSELGDLDGSVNIVGSNEVNGWAKTTIGCGAEQYVVYFTAQFDQPFAAQGTWTGTALHPGETSANGGQSGAYVTFDGTGNSVVHVRTAISFVSVANAQLNLQMENPGWDFDAVRQAADAAWESRLSAIQVDGPNPADQQVFYTALYHTMFHPNIFDDVNGQYLGFDNAVHQVDPGHHQYCNIPGWDQYRSESQLLSLLVPDVMSDIVQSYLNDAAQGGPGLPRWEQMNHNSNGMVGDGPVSYIANAYAFGARDFDTGAALNAMVANAGVVGTTSDGHTVRTNLGEYLASGFIGQDHNGASASYALEYETADFALSSFAVSLGDKATAQTFLSHALFWRNLFNPQTLYITPRNSDGSFISINPSSETGFTEGSQAQYTWMLPFDLGGLFDAMGGNAAAVNRLDTLFTQLNAGPDSIYAFMGNEPSEGTPWAYDFAGAPWKTQEVVRRIQTQLFTTHPNGLPGNDDAGAMSSWYVFSALGLYPDLPGLGGFVVGSPLFSSITVNLEGGQTLRITAANAADANPYVQSMTINGVDNTHLWLPVDTILNNSITTLDFEVDSTANTDWGSAPEDAPPSFDRTPAPPTPVGPIAALGTAVASPGWAATSGGQVAVCTDATAPYQVISPVDYQTQIDSPNENPTTPPVVAGFSAFVHSRADTNEPLAGYIGEVGLETL